MSHMAQMLMPICQNMLASMLPKPKVEADFLKPLAIQMDEDFAAMAERYFDNIYDGRMETPHQLVELIRKYSACGHHAPDMAREKHEHTEHSSWSDKAPHRVFMAAVDKMISTPAKADEIIAEHFEGLSEDEKRVLKRYAKSRPSTKAQAQAENMTEELYTARLEAIMQKTK